MWSLPKTCLNYVNYAVLSNWALTKGNLSQLNPQQERGPMSKGNRLITLTSNADQTSPTKA